MKCANCYADNPYFMTACAACGREADPILVCPAGHIMAAGELLCPRCTTKWPELSSFNGPPVLRGVVVPVEGRMLHQGHEVGLWELRDADSPIGFAEGRSPRDVNITLGSEESLVARLATRPDGVQICARTDLAAENRSLEYVAVESRSVVSVASARLQVILFDVPSSL